MFAIDAEDDDLNIGGDIFSDFNEDLEAGQIMEDERFYRYGRFYCFNVFLGKTSFTGNRGKAYSSGTESPSFGTSLTYFMNFQNAFGLGFAYSKHHMLINARTETFNQDGGPGLIEANFFRSFFFYRYYLDTADLGTAITYSNPYAIGQFEYWYQTNKFIDRTASGNKSGGVIGFAYGLGLEFPISIKETYLGVEVLAHSVSLSDTNSPDYRPITVKDKSGNIIDNPGGYGDLRGTPLTIFISYVINW